MSQENTEQLKKFVFTSKVHCGGKSSEERLEIIIPEVLGLLLLKTYLQYANVIWFVGLPYVLSRGKPPGRCTRFYNLLWCLPKVFHYFLTKL